MILNTSPKESAMGWPPPRPGPPLRLLRDSLGNRPERRRIRCKRLSGLLLNLRATDVDTVNVLGNRVVAQSGSIRRGGSNGAFAWSNRRSSDRPQVNVHPSQSIARQGQRASPSSVSLRNVAPKLWDLAGRPRKVLVRLVLASLVAGVTEAAAILVVVRLAIEVASDQVESDFVPLVGAPSSVGMTLAIAVALVLCTVLGHFLTARETASIGARVLRAARQRAIVAFSDASWSRQATERQGALQETVTSLSQRCSATAQSLTNATASAAMLTVFLVIAVVINPLGFLAIGAGGAVTVMAIRPLSRRTRGHGESASRSNVEFAEDAARFSAAAMELRAFGVMTQAAQVVDEVGERAAESQRSARFMSLFASSIYRDVAVLLMIAIVGALAVLGSAAAGTAGAVGILMLRSLSLAQAINSSVQTLHEQGTSVLIFDERVRSLASGPTEPGQMQVDRIERVAFRDVSYSYPNGAEAIRSSSFQVSSGEIVGLVGPSGSGKSTLLQLALRLRTPSSGQVLVDGVDYRDVADESWARLVAFVPQEPTLIEGTVADNIRFFRSFSAAEVETAVEVAHLAELVAGLPDGIDTQLGPKAAGVSGGQKQRIAFARAVIGAPRVLCLDEPTSALDAASEAWLSESVRAAARRGAAVILATHRESTLELCDRLYDVSNQQVTPIAGVRGETN